MPSLTRVMILYCGQGMTTLVEIYGDGVVKPAADYLALIDCGGSIPKGAGIAVNYVANKILAKADKRLNVLSISHQDADHVRLLSDLTTKLTGQGATCARIFAGGSNWSSTNQSTVKEFAKVVGVNPGGIVFGVAQCTDYGNATKRDELTHLDQFGDVYLRVLISGLAISGSADIQKNGSSAMVVIENGSFSVVLPGDATYQTMDAVTTILQRVQPSLLPTVTGLEIPHHGALRTSVENYYAGGQLDDFNWTKLKEFARVLNAKQVVASAGPNNSFHHPIEEVLQVFAAGLDPMARHDYASWVYVSWFGNAGGAWTNWNTGKAVSSTVQRLDLIQGTEVVGDLEISITKPGLVAPQDMVRFIPRALIPGGDGPEGGADRIVFAPAPFDPAPAT
jgi:hypothetical protein